MLDGVSFHACFLYIVICIYCVFIYIVIYIYCLGPHACFLYIVIYIYCVGRPRKEFLDFAEGVSAVLFASSS
jgi:hypothetical protein